MTQANTSMTRAKLEAGLRGTGISPDRLLESALTAIGQIRRREGSEPQREFSAAERDALEAGDFDLRPASRRARDPIALTTARLTALLADSLTVSQLAQALGVTPARVRQRAAARTLYAIRSGDAWRFPRWQFDEHDREVPGLGSVFAVLPAAVHPVAVWRFLTEPSPDLELSGESTSPMAWLRAGGQPDQVATLARDL